MDTKTSNKAITKTSVMADEKADLHLDPNTTAKDDTKTLAKPSSLMIFIVLLSLVCALLYFLQLETSLAYRRVEIEQGQWWRLITGNLLHTNHWHLVMNLGGLWVMYLLHGFHFRTKGYVVLILLLCVLEGLGLFLFYPGLNGYVGLSGILHGLFTLGAIQDIRAKYRAGWALLIGVIAKVSYEQYFGASEDVTALIDARVATESHLIGMCAGLICGLGLLAYHKLSKK